VVYKISGSIILMLALLVLGAWNFHATVRTERTFNASVADVWRVWNDADSIKKWWGPRATPRSSSGTTCERVAAIFGR
jgi:hypothetical protein